MPLYVLEPSEGPLQFFLSADGIAQWSSTTESSINAAGPGASMLAKGKVEGPDTSADFQTILHLLSYSRANVCIVAGPGVGWTPAETPRRLATAYCIDSSALPCAVIYAKDPWSNSGRRPMGCGDVTPPP